VSAEVRSYSGIYMYQLIPNLLTELYKQKESGHKIKTLMYLTKTFITFDEPHSCPEEFSPTVLI
jgi:hypothetical protein